MNCYTKIIVSLVAQLVKSPPAMWETQVQSLGWEDPLEKEMTTHWSLAGYSPCGHKESDMTEWLSLHTKIVTLMFQVFNGHFNSFLSFLGACIHLRDPELALAIESCLKGLLQAYCCHNHADERVLQALMKKFYSPGTSRPQIIVSEFRNEMYDVRHR